MKKQLSILFLFMCLLFVPRAKAQTNVLVGVSGMNEFSNMSVGVTAGLSTSFLRRYEVTLMDSYSPYENHIGQGLGHANVASVGGLTWLTEHWGVSGKIEDSGYNVTKVSKSAIMVLGGITTRQYFLDVPTRFTFGYAQQINNGITNGIETSQLHGVYLAVDGRPYCNNAFCIRLQEQFALGRVLQQGNPICDGTFGAVSPVLSCPRTASIGGGVSLNVLLDFHRRSKNYDKF